MKNANRIHKTRKMNITKLTQINHKNKKQAQDLTYLLNQYAQDPMGGGKRVSHSLTFMTLWY